MGFPSRRELELALLEAIEVAGGQMGAQVAIDKMTERFQITPEEQQMKRKSGNPKWQNDVRWVRQALVGKGFLDPSTYGKWAITEQGQAYLRTAMANKQLSMPIAPVAVQSPSSILVTDEDDLYEPAKKWVKVNWGAVVDAVHDDYWVLITARQRKGNQGKWSRPDLTWVRVNRFVVLPQRLPEVITFEVKRNQDAKDIASVHEALSHLRWGHKTYLVAEVPSGNSRLPKDVEDEAMRFGVGVMLMYKQEGEYELEEVIEAKRHEPDPKTLDEGLGYTFKGDPAGFNRLKDALRSQG